MLCPPTVHDMTRLAELVWREAGGEPEVAQAAVIWSLLNRRSGLIPAALRREASAGPSRAGKGGVGFDDADFCRAFATLCLVCGGDLEDPTHGATRYHAHDELPEWARRRQPRALIGRRFFY